MKEQQEEMNKKKTEDKRTRNMDKEMKIKRGKNYY